MGIDRRGFLKQAAITATAATVSSATQNEAGGDDGSVFLENDQALWEFALPGKPGETRLHNKLTGRRYTFRRPSELQLTFSAAKARIEIPAWRCVFGKPGETASAGQDSGYRAGYHQPAFDDRAWGTCANLCLYWLDSVPFGESLPISFDGYGWFRTRFELPGGARDQDIFLTLGGYDHTDWKRYWIFVNGVEVGSRENNERWHHPGQFRIESGSAAYQSLEFGGANVIAVRTHGIDRHFPGITENQLARYLFDPILCDQFVTVGAPYAQAADFTLLAQRNEHHGTRPGAVFELENKSHGVRLVLRYELEGPIRRKWAEVINTSSEPKLLLDADLDSFELDGVASDGGYGFPVTVDNQMFCAIEHPSGSNCANGPKVYLRHFPGRWIQPGKSWQSHSSIIGVARSDGAQAAFLDYIERRTPRKKEFMALYDSLGITSFPEGWNWTMNDDENQGILDLLADFQRKGIYFDYYIPELSLDTTESSDLTRYRLFSFPDGPGDMTRRVNEMGIRFGQWFSIIGGLWSNYRNPEMAPSYIPDPAGPVHVTFRHGYADGDGRLCVASEPYFSTLRNAIVHHVKENRVELLKLDNSYYYCNSDKHEHLPGKYSTEAHYNRLLELSRAIRSINPNAVIVWYWGAYSPFFALHGAVVFDTRIALEAASTGDYPAMFFRDGVTQALDQASQFAKWLPPMNHDSLGVWLADIGWGNFMGTERWQEAAAMDLGRGNLMFPQLWSDLYSLEDHDLEFLARMQALAKRNQDVFLTRRYLIGDPWKDEIYGYSYFDEAHGFIFLNNMSFESRQVHLNLGGQIGLRVQRGQRLGIRSHHPGEAVLVRNGNPDFRGGETLDLQLRPFEVLMIEVRPESISESGFARREAIEAVPYSFSLPIHKISGAENLEVPFSDAAALTKEDLAKQFSAFEARLPDYAGARHHLAIVNRFRQGEQWWRQHQMSRLVQPTATVNGIVLEFTRTPDYRQTNIEYSPWIVFRSPLPVGFSGKELQFGITSYLPADVHMSTELWVVRQWWRPRKRPLPNHWT